MNISLDKYIWNTFLNDATNMLSDTFLDDATGIIIIIIKVIFNNYSNIL